MSLTNPILNTSNILYDYIPLEIKFGEFQGSIVTKLKPTTAPLIFSEYISIEPGRVKLTGLMVGLDGKKAYSSDKKDIEIRLNHLDYCIQLAPSLTKEFDQSRLTATFPNILRMLHTACVYLETDQNIVNHLDFVTGEILNRPVAVTHNNGVIIGDRLVVEEGMELYIYDAIVINRDTRSQLFTTFEDYMSINPTDLCSLVLLGSENF
jgi:hypothetical protein